MMENCIFNNTVGEHAFKIEFNAEFPRRIRFKLPSSTSEYDAHNIIVFKIIQSTTVYGVLSPWNSLVAVKICIFLLTSSTERTHTELAFLFLSKKNE